MIIECGSCKSRFRLDESKITGRGARVRCRKCGEAITVMKDDVADQGGTAAAAPGEQEEGLDLRSILRETMDAPTPPAAEPAGPEALQSDVDKMLADAAKEAEAETAAPPAAVPQGQPQAGAPIVDFGPEEKLTFQQPGRDEPTPVAGDAAPTQPPASSGPDISSEFMMSTADSLDFLKADYDQGERKAALDISGSLRIAPAPGAERTTVAPPLGTQGVPAAPPPVEPPSRSETIRGELAGLGSAGAAGAAGAEAVAAAKAPAAAPLRPRAAASPPPPPREMPAPTPLSVVRTRPTTKKPALTRGQGSQLVRPSVVLLLLLFFALAGGGAYLGFTSDGQRVLRGLVPQIESLWLGGGKPASRFEVGNLIGYYETNAAAGKIFVIKGQVTNEGRSRKTGVRVYAALLDAQSKQVAEKTVYAGNVFAGDALRKATREKIEAAMSNPIGGGLANMDIPPGKAVPFMVVFFDVPDGIDSYRLEPRDVD